MTQQDKREMFRHNLYMAVLNAHKHGMSWHHIREALTGETSAIADTDDLAMREETTSEHVARDMREGRFPQRSEPRQVTEPSDVVGHKTIDTGERCPEPGTPIMRHEPLTRAEADALCAAAYAAKEDREKRMPDEQSALRAIDLPDLSDKSEAA